LTTRLDASDGTVALVVAPPGYGKTTLVSQLTAGAEQPFAWLTVTEEDNDPSALLAYLALALDTIESLDPQTFAALAMSEADLVSIRLPRLGNVLANRSLPFVLVLDDVHLLHSSGSVAVLERLADQMPLGSQLVLAGRSDPPLSLPRMSANGELLESGPDSLAMSEPEADAPRARAWADERTLESLVVQIEGWPRASISRRSRCVNPSPAAAAERFAGHDRLVADYLHDEALRTFPDELREFLVRTSVLDRLSARVCDDVLDRTDSARMLEEIDASRPVPRPARPARRVVPLPPSSGTCSVASSTGSTRRSSRHCTRASTWWEHHGDIDCRAAPPRAEGDLDRMSALIWCNAPDT
jgi:LuxR family maltose regulon positive regulatory protein